MGKHKMMTRAMYGGRDNRYGSMIHEDYSAPSNLPREVKRKMYPKEEAMYEGLDDTIGGIDADSRHNHSQLRKYRSKETY